MSAPVSMESLVTTGRVFKARDPRLLTGLPEGLMTRVLGYLQEPRPHPFSQERRSILRLGAVCGQLRGDKQIQKLRKQYLADLNLFDRVLRPETGEQRQAFYSLARAVATRMILHTDPRTSRIRSIVDESGRLIPLNREQKAILGLLEQLGNRVTAGIGELDEAVPVQPRGLDPVRVESFIDLFLFLLLIAAHCINPQSINPFGCLVDRLEEPIRLTELITTDAAVFTLVFTLLILSIMIRYKIGFGTILRVY